MSEYIDQRQCFKNKYIIFILIISEFNIKNNIKHFYLILSKKIM